MGISPNTIYTYGSGTFPNFIATNSTGAATQDGTEIIAEGWNNFILGPWQALFDYAGITPDGVTEAAGSSQWLECIQKAFGVGPGKLVGWWLADDPSVTGDRVLLLQGQGILIANYPELTGAVYVGDGNNTAVAAGGGKFYKSSDSAGTIPDIAGTYLQLPDLRGYVLRGLDVAGSVDPGGASRFMGDTQLDASQGWQAGGVTGTATYWGRVAADNQYTVGSSNTTYGLIYYKTTFQGTSAMITALNDGTNGTPRKSSETRMINVSIQWGITY